MGQAAREEQDDGEEYRRIEHQVEARLADVVGELQLGRLQQQRADHRAGQGAHSAEVDHQRHRDAHQRIDHELRVHVGDVVAVDPADHADQARRDGEGGHLVGAGRDSEREGPVLVVANGQQAEAEPGAEDEPGGEERRGR